MRVVGTNSFRYANGSGDGSISVLKGNFTPSTDYEWHTKAWCTGNVDANGDSDPMYHSGWGEFSSFTTEAPCDKMPVNLTTSANGAQTAITMSWDTPESGAPDHYFLQLTNVTSGQVWEWNNLAGSSNSKTKFGLTAGEYSWRIRGACGTNGTSWATIYSQPVEFTLGGARLANDLLFNVYPNPAIHQLNISLNFTEVAKVKVNMLDLLGNELFTFETEVNGKFTKQIDLTSIPSGIYVLEIHSETTYVTEKVIIH